MSIVLVRIDDRLLHGQIVEAWVPYCKATCIIVANDEAKKNRVQRLAIESCASRTLTVKVDAVEESVQDAGSEALERERIIVLFSTLKDLIHAYDRGFRFSCINIGNIHHNGFGKQLANSVYIDKEDEDIIKNLVSLGIDLDIRAVPWDKPVKVMG